MLIGKGRYWRGAIVWRKAPFKESTPQNKKFNLIRSLQRDLKSVPLEAKIVFYDDFPAGYLMSFRTPGMCGVWTFTSGTEILFRRLYVDCMPCDSNLFVVKLNFDSRLPELFPWHPLTGDPYDVFIMKNTVPTQVQTAFYEIRKMDKRACLRLRDEIIW